MICPERQQVFILFVFRYIPKNILLVILYLVMQSEELSRHVKELRASLQKASGIAEKLVVVFPEMEEPALRAQCSVIQAFLRQTERQEEILAKMVSARESDKTRPTGF